MKYHRVIDELKDDLMRREKLIASKAVLIERVNNGQMFFQRYKSSSDGEKLSEGAKLIIDLLSEIGSIEAEIRDIDLVLISKFEMLTGDFIGKLQIPSRMNSAGDINPVMEIMLVPLKMEESELTEIEPQDVYFFKMAKEIFRSNNIQVVNKFDNK